MKNKNKDKNNNNIIKRNNINNIKKNNNKEKIIIRERFSDMEEESEDENYIEQLDDHKEDYIEKVSNDVNISNDTIKINIEKENNNVNTRSKRIIKKKEIMDL